MNIVEAIKVRRSMLMFKPDLIPKEVLEEIRLNAVILRENDILINILTKGGSY